jgi:hypothetical protein
MEYSGLNAMRSASLILVFNLIVGFWLLLNKGFKNGLMLYLDSCVEPRENTIPILFFM